MAGERRLCLRELREERRLEARRRHDHYTTQYRLSEERLAAERLRLEDERRRLEATIARFHAALAVAGYPGAVPVTVPEELVSATPPPGSRQGLRRGRREAEAGRRAWILSMPFEQRLHPLDAAVTWHRWVLLSDGRLGVVRDEQKEHLEMLSRRLGSARLESELARRGSPSRTELSARGRSPLVERAGKAAVFFDDKDFDAAGLRDELLATARRHGVALSES